MADDELDVREEFNSEQRQKLIDLAFQAAEKLDLIGEHALGDAILLVEEVDDEGTSILVFSTTKRVSVRRGILEHARDEMATFTWVPDADIDE